MNEPAAPSSRPAPPDAPPAVDGWRPLVTYGLIAANIAFFLLELGEGGGGSGPALPEMVSLGANFGPLTRGGQPWRLVTAMFLHFGVVHLAMNMVCLYQVRFIERVLGRAGFLAVYFVSGWWAASPASRPIRVSSPRAHPARSSGCSVPSPR